MNVEKLSTNITNANLIREVKTGMLKKALDQTEQTARQLLDALSTNILTDSTIDIKI